MMYTELCQNKCSADEGITTRTEKHHYLLLTMKLLNQELKSSLRQLYVVTMAWFTDMEYMCRKWPRLCSTCREHFPVLSSSWFVTGFVTRLTWRVPLVRQELLILLDHLGSLPVFSGVHVSRSLVLCVLFCR